MKNSKLSLIAVALVSVFSIYLMTPGPDRAVAQNPADDQDNIPEFERKILDVLTKYKFQLTRLAQSLRSLDRGMRFRETTWSVTDH